MKDDYARRASDRPWRVHLIFTLIVIAMLALMLAALLAGRATAHRLTVREAEAAPTPRALPQDVSRFHDASEEVTCWRTPQGIACLPDQWLASAREVDAP